MVFDKISLSKFYTLNSVRKNFNRIIYFNKINFINSKNVMKKTNNTKIFFFLNGEEIDETDVRMNYPLLMKVNPARSRN